MLAGILVGSPLVEIHPVEFWVLFCLIVGGLHLYALLDYPRNSALRTALCWISGSFWMWVSLATHPDISSMATFWLGISNIVAFIINTVLLSEKWNSF